MSLLQLKLLKELIRLTEVDMKETQQTFDLFAFRHLSDCLMKELNCDIDIVPHLPESHMLLLRLGPFHRDKDPFHDNVKKRKALAHYLLGLGVIDVHHVYKKPIFRHGHSATLLELLTKIDCYYELVLDVITILKPTVVSEAFVGEIMNPFRVNYGRELKHPLCKANIMRIFLTILKERPFFKIGFRVVPVPHSFVDAISIYHKLLAQTITHLLTTQLLPDLCNVATMYLTAGSIIFHWNETMYLSE